MIAEQEKVYATAGFAAYDEGCHDDVNKHVWLAVFWGCDEHASSSCVMGGRNGLVAEWIYQYTSLHMSPYLADDLTELIFQLEEDWVGPVVGNPTINATFALLQQIQSNMTPRDRLQWRLQQLLYRANYDRFVRCAFFDRIFHSRMQLVPTPLLHLKRACV